MKSVLFLILSALSFLSTAAGAETIVAKRISAANRFVPLKKITVGPDDQYQAALTAGGSELVFTHKADLVAHLKIQNLASGEIRDLLPLNADSQEASVSPDGKIAFTYYKFSARGDICWVPQPSAKGKAFTDSDIKCLKRTEASLTTERANPFWLSSSEIGYLERDVQNQNMRILTEVLSDAGHKRELARGRVWSPVMSPGGHFLIYSELSGSEASVSRGFVLKDIADGKTYPVHFSLPGLSGFPALSEDETFLYFSHYFNDTNRDHVIDGNDNGVVFRIPITKILTAQANEELFPEQLTSVESSCSFPRPFRDSVFVTCAFEGSLDIYQIPATGIVPVKWDSSLLKSALQTSRTYQDRILVLNAMKYRGFDSEIDERLLTNHILADDLVAARYFLSRLASHHSGTERAFDELTRIYLQARDRKKAQPPGDVSRSFEKEIDEFLSLVTRTGGPERMNQLVRGLLNTFVNKSHEADISLKRARAVKSAYRPLERYLAFELASRIFDRQPSSRQNLLFEMYHETMAASELSAEARIFYAVSLLRYLQKNEPSRAARISAIEKISHDLPAEVTSLLKSEAVTLRLIEARADKDKLVIYRDLDALMSATRGDYFLRKALYVRAILNFTDSAEFKYLNFVATNWLRYTQSDDTEFSYARAVFSDAALDQAYDSIGKHNLDFARDYFYQTLSLTDDLEAHEGYVSVLNAKGQRASIDEKYKNLQSREFIGDNMKFVQALLLLIDAQGKAAADPGYVKHLDEAIAKLESMEQDRDSAVRYLLLGACQYEKLMRTGAGFEFNAELFQKANHSLTLAYDLGRDNVRVKASALTNLGLLHRRVQNHGLAAKYLAIRKRIGFESNDEHQRFSGLYAYALFHSHQPEQAAAELSELGGDQPPAIREPQAFYSMSAGLFKEAADLYGELFKAGKISGDLNLAKAQLAYGYSLLKLKRGAEAREALRSSLEHSAHLTVLKAGDDRLVDFHPARLELIATGLLSQVTDGAERTTALERRGNLLLRAKDLVDQWQGALVQNRLQLADAESRSHPTKAAAWMNEALKLAEDFGDKNQYLGQVTYRAGVSYMAHALSHPELYRSENPKHLEKVVNRCLEAYLGQKTRPPLLDYQGVKLKILWSAYSARVLGKPLAQNPESVLGANSDLKVSMPTQWNELENLVAVLR